MSTLATVLVKFDAKGDDLDRGFDAIGHKATSIGSVIGKALAAGAVVATTAIVGFTAKGLQEFTAFDKGMREVFTLLPGITEEAMGDMTQQVKDFSAEFGVLPEKTIPALYQAISAGVPKDNVFEFLATAQKAAAGGCTELETAVDGISSVINAYGTDVLSATEASDLMFTAVRLGKTTFEELANTLYNVVPIAAALGVEFGDLTAAIAVMTAQGTPTSVATTQLRQMFVELSKAGGDVDKVFRQIAGQSFKEFIAAGGSTQDALKLLEQYAKDAGIGINDLFGSVEAGNAALALTGKGTDAFSKALEAMGTSAGATEEAYGRMAGSIQTSLDKLRAAWHVILITVGEKVAPVFQSFVDWIVRHMPQIQSVIEKVMNAVGAAFNWVKDQIIPRVVEAFRWLADVLNTFRTDGLSAGMARIGQAVAEALPWIQEKLGELARAFVDWIGPKIPGILAALGQMLFKIAEWIVTVALPAIVRQLGEWARAFVEWIGPKIPEILAKLGELQLKLIEWIVTVALPAIVEQLGTWAWEFAVWVVRVWPLLKEKLEAFWTNDFKPWLADLPMKIGEAIGYLGEVLVQAGKDAITGFLKGMKLMWLQVQIWLGLIKDPEIIKAVGDTTTTLEEKGETVINGFWAGMKFSWLRTSAWLLQVGAYGIKEALGNLSNILESSGKDALAGLWRGMQSMWESVDAWCNGLAQKIGTAVGDLGSLLYNAGRNVLQGLWNGARDKFDSMIAWFRSVGTSIANAVKGALGIHSPSDVFHDVGINTMAGLVEGIEAALPLVDRALGAVVGRLSNSIGGTSAHVDGPTPNGPAIARADTSLMQKLIAAASTQSGPNVTIESIVINGGGREANEAVNVITTRLNGLGVRT